MTKKEENSDIKNTVKSTGENKNNKADNVTRNVNIENDKNDAKKVETSLNRKIDKIVNKSIDEKVDKIFEENLDDKVDKLVDENLDEKVDKLVDDTLSLKVDKLVDQKLKENKKHNISKALIFILVMALILALIYIAYDKGFIPKPSTGNNDVVDNKDNDKETDDKNNINDNDLIVKLDVNDDIVTNTYNRVTRSTRECGVWEYFKDKRVSVTSLKNEFVYEVAVVSAEDMFGKMNLTEEQFSKVVSNIFGKGYNYNHVQYTDKCAKFVYNWNTKSYDYQSDPVCGGTCTVTNFKKVVGAYKDGNKLTIEVGVLFAQYNNGNVAYYKDYNHTVLVTGLTYSQPDSFVLDDTEDNARKGTIYDMVFELEDGNYVYKYTESTNK